MANWFVNSNNVFGLYDGTSTLTAWRTINRPLTGTDNWLILNDEPGTGPVTDAGDIVWFKDDHNETWDTFDSINLRYNHGSHTNPIIYKADLAGDHFAVAGGSKPIINMAANNNATFRYASNYGSIEFWDIDFAYPAAGTHAPTSFWYLGNANTAAFYNCDFTNMYGNWYATNGGGFRFINCTFNYTRDTDAYASMFIRCRASFYLRDVTLTGCNSFVEGVNGTTGTIQGENITLNAPETAAGSEIFKAPGSGGDIVVAIDGMKIHSDWAAWVDDPTDFTLMTNISVMNYDSNPRLYRLDRGGTIGTMISSETGADLRTGGADQTLVFTPGANCAAPLRDFVMENISVWHPANQSRDYKVWVKLDDGAGGEWSAYPDATGIIFEVQYFDTATEVTRTTVATTDTISTDSWTLLTVSGISPAEDGMVKLRFRVAANDGGSGERVLLDPGYKVA